MKIKSNLLRAAQMCQAKSDVRYYLCGIHINKDKVEAANGHTAVRMTMDKKVRGEYILNIKGIVPKRAHESKFEFDKDESIVKHFDFCGQLMSVHPVEVLSGRFPDINRVIPKEKKKVDEIGVDIKYIEKFGKMFGDKGLAHAKVELFGRDAAMILTSASEITNREYGRPMFIVMPTRF